MNSWRRPSILLALVALVGLTLPTTKAEARSKRGVKKLAMKEFDAGSRDVSVMDTAKGSDRGGAALVRLTTSDVASCRLLILDKAPRKAKAIVKSLRMPVCPAYDKHARDGKLERVPFTTSRSAWRVRVGSKRVDALAKGVETRQFWGLYADIGRGTTPVFERTATSFESKANKAINQTEVCEAPVFPVGHEPTTLTVQCIARSMLGQAMTRKNVTHHYKWQHGRFSLR